MYNSYPEIDLHGYDRDYARIVVDEFINDNIKLRNRNIRIIHGRGSGVLKKEIHEYLRKNKRVLKYFINMYNDGETIVNLKID